MRSNSYGSYHGQSRFRTFLKVIIVLLLVVLILAVTAFFLLEKYMVYTSEGPRLTLPFFQQEVTAQTPLPTPSDYMPLVVVTPSPTPTPTPTPEVLHAVLLPRVALYDGTAETQTAAAGANAALFDMKADSGSLGYISDSALAKEAGASASDPALNTAILALNEGELYTIARVSCFLDNATPKKRPAVAIKTNSGYNWRDGDDLRWMSPTQEEARAYVAEICVELAKLGFNEIVLEHSGYPTQGKLTHIKKGAAYAEAQFESVITAFYAQMRQALAGYPEVKLSIVASESAVMDGIDTDSGQSIAALSQYADRVWLLPAERDITEYAAALTAAGAKDVATGLVPIVATVPEDVGTSWAIMTVKK